jgi:chemotaxis signal transduction protein
MSVVAFESAGRRYWLDAAEVRALKPAPSICPVPTATTAILGLTQVDGEILCVLDPIGPRSEGRGLVRLGSPMFVVEALLDKRLVRAALAVDRVLGIWDAPPSDCAPLDLRALFTRVRAS